MHACNIHLLTIVPTYDDVFLTVARDHTHISNKHRLRTIVALLRLKLSVFLVYRMANKLDDSPYLVLFPVLVYPFKTPPVITETLIV